NSPNVRQDYNRLKKIMLTNDKWNLMNDLTHLLDSFNEYTEYFSGSEYVIISMMYLLITALKIKLCPITQDFDLTLDFNSDNNAFDNDLEYEDDEEEITVGLKKRRIKINTPTNTSGLQDHIKLSLYKALLHYWPTPNIN
ncbi:3268_t:CDS:1, partial [Racocetra fulgida]